MYHSRIAFRHIIMQIIVLLFLTSCTAVDNSALDLAISELETAQAELLKVKGTNDNSPKEAKNEVMAVKAEAVERDEVVTTNRASPAQTLGGANTTRILPHLPDDGEIYSTCSTDAECGGKKLCVEGKCKCPVVFKGDNCDEPRTPEQSWCLTPLKEWPAVGPKYTKLDRSPISFATCAVVGSSGEMRGSGLGAEIDAHSAIFRFNEAPASKLFRQDVGSFTTLRFQNRDRSGFAEVKGEICVVRAGKWSKGQDSGGKCRFIQMPTPVERYVDGHWKMYRQGARWPADDVGRPWFSNGFAGIAFAMHMCGRVDVYGFTFGSGYYFPKYKGPAKSWGRRGGFIRPPSKALDTRHSWKRESTCLEMLAEMYPSQVSLKQNKLTKVVPVV